MSVRRKIGRAELGRCLELLAAVFIFCGVVMLLIAGFGIVAQRYAEPAAAVVIPGCIWFAPGFFSGAFAVYSFAQLLIIRAALERSK